MPTRRPGDGATFISAEPLNQPADGVDRRRRRSRWARPSAGGATARSWRSAAWSAGSPASSATLLIGSRARRALVGDAYTTAQFLPGMVYELLLGGILTSVLIPLLVRRRKADPDGGQAYTQRLLTLAVVALGVATLLAVAARPAVHRALRQRRVDRRTTASWSRRSPT